MRRVITLAIVIGALLSGMNAQAPAFDAVSIRPTRSKLPGGMMDFRAGGQFIAENEVALQLIRAA